ncbi:hypothetical protein Cgig2_002722 [Carnegiea gigantea]|uniref:Uncharacterized protein n=1 Tax=Carnegiea gigantea TaxID=171969 RepID=A0A9Q1Q727_9CARY|nr:hypothetical protein Cgig2_002722 [Carnegiea gigantea]
MPTSISGPAWVKLSVGLGMHACYAYKVLPTLMGGCSGSLIWPHSSDMVVLTTLLQQGGDEKMPMLSWALDSGGSLLLIGETGGSPVVHTGEAHLQLEVRFITILLYLYYIVRSTGAGAFIRYAFSALILTITLQQGEHNVMDASLPITNTASAASTEAETMTTVEATERAPLRYGYPVSSVVSGGDEKRRRLLWRRMQVDPRLHMQLVCTVAPMSTLPSIRCLLQWGTRKAAVRRVTGPPHASIAKDTALSSPLKAGLGEDAIRNDLLQSMFAKGVDLLRAVQKWCKSLRKPTDWIAELTGGGAEHISAFDMKGLVKGLRREDPRDKACADAVVRLCTALAVDGGGFEARHIVVYALLPLTRTPNQHHRQEVGSRAGPHEARHLHRHCYMGGHSPTMLLVDQECYAYTACEP